MSSSSNQTPAKPDFETFTDTHGVVVSTMNDLPGYKIVKAIGTVYGLSVRSRNLFVDVGAGLKSLAGGEVTPITRMLYSGRNQAVERMLGECLGKGGNAVIAMRFDDSSIGIWAQICAYGTACIVEKID